MGIQKYLKDKYAVESTYIPYGSHVIKEYSFESLKKYNVTAHQYSMLIARLESENRFEII